DNTVSSNAASYGTFTVAPTFQSVTLINNSNRDMIVQGIDVVDATPGAQVNIKAAGNTLQFKVEADDTIDPHVRIENTSALPSNNNPAPTITLAGIINNPTGLTSVIT